MMNPVSTTHATARAMLHTLSYTTLFRSLHDQSNGLTSLIGRRAHANIASDDREFALEIDSMALVRQTYLFSRRQEAVRHALVRSEEHTSELQSPYDVVCRLLLEKTNGQW